MASVSLPRIRFALKQGAGQCLTRLGLLERLHRGRVVILAYHRVLPDDLPHAAEPAMYVTETAFRRQMAFLKAHYDVLALPKWLAAWRAGSLHRRGRYCLLTFDDGWRDTFAVAFPVLRALRLPATVFLATAFIGTARWFWTETVSRLLLQGDLRRLAASLAAPAPDSPWRDLQPLRRLYNGADDRARRGEALGAVLDRLKRHPVERLTAFGAELARALGQPLPSGRICLSWEEAREMSQAGICFGSHTAEHRILPGLPPELVRRELTVSRAELASHGLAVAPVFCYPNGAYDARVKALVREAGYEAAMTTRYGAEPLVPADPFALRRIGVHQDVASTDALLGLRLAAAPRGAVAGAVS